MYRAMAQDGTIVKNKVQGLSKLEIIKKLKENNLVPIEITEQSSIFTKKPKRNVNKDDEIVEKLDKLNDSTSIWKKEINLEVTQNKVSTRDIVVFTQNLYLLKKANFNNINAISTLIKNTENKVLKNILEDILEGLEKGEYMYTTMEYYKDVFPYIYTNMIKVGELSGTLTNSLEQAARYLDDTDKINRKLKSIIIPNLFQFIFLVVMLFAGTLIAIPAIQDVFIEIGTQDQLPAITLWFQGVVNNFLANWYIPTFLVIAIAAIIFGYTRTSKGKYQYHKWKYSMPIFGELIWSIDFSRFIKAVHLNLKNGVSIEEALEISKNVVKNVFMMSIVETSINNMLVGKSWIEPFEKYDKGLTVSHEMLKIGMETNLIEMMEKLIDFIDLDVRIKLEKVMKTLPQVVALIVGLVLIFFVIVVIVPCIQVYMGNFIFSAYDV